MKPWVQLGTAPIPGTTEAMRLRQRGNEFAISIGSAELMNSFRNQSERALSTLACKRLADAARARILIGGLGMGFTLRAALDGLGPQSRVVVAELVPGVVDWARDPLAHLFAGSLDDPRVELRVEDVLQTVAASRAAFDAILLDVDNGPEAFTRRANDRLYEPAGLTILWKALRPRGVLAVWSNGPDRAFAGSLRQTGFEVEEVRIHAAGRSGQRHVLWFAKRM